METNKSESAIFLEKAKNSFEYKNYLEVREEFFRMIDGVPKNSFASSYWAEELAGFDYLLDASPLIIQKLRHHTYHLTGIQEYNYRQHHAGQAKILEKKLNLL